jgi:hypothetical protein
MEEVEGGASGLCVRSKGAGDISMVAGSTWARKIEYKSECPDASTTVYAMLMFLVMLKNIRNVHTYLLVNINDKCKQVRVYMICAWEKLLF